MHEEFFGELAVGQMGDLDLLVRRADLEPARRGLARAGFCQGVFSAERAALVPVAEHPREDEEEDHYELYPFMRLEDIGLAPQPGVEYELPVFVAGDRLRAVVQIDLHFGVATNVGAEQFFERAVERGGALTMAAADQVWFTTARFYTEVATDGKRSLRDFAYVLPQLAAGGLQWSLVLEANERYLLHPALYYYLSFMNWLGDGRLVPDPVLESLSPRLGPRRRDWGWQLGVLFGGVEPPPFAGASL